MTLRDDILPIAYSARAIAGELGFRPYRVYVLTGSWSGQHTGEGSETETETELTEAGGQSPKVRFLNDEEIAVGQLVAGTVAIGPITPAFSGGGTDLSTIQPSLDAGETIHVRLDGPYSTTAKLFKIQKVTADRALRYVIEAAPVS